MRSDKFLLKICMEIYRELYKAADPSVDFDELMSNGTTKKKNWFMEYHLDEQLIADIIESHFKRHKCNALERCKISATIYLGCCPTSVKKDV